MKISNKNFPDIKQLGNIKDINFNSLPKIDLLIGGSPCQDLSNGYKGGTPKGLTGERSKLFFDYVNAKKN
jgi:site-specific DNA-cytosine methylase